VRVVSYGGGKQSTAFLVLAAQGAVEPFDAWLFADVGHDSEHPKVGKYLVDHAIPYAEAHGITLTTVCRKWRDGRDETLLGTLRRPGSRSVGIPVRMANGAPGRRSCTADFKIRVVGQWMREHGATVERPADTAILISTDEIERAKPGTDVRMPYQRRFYPLIDLGLSRADCIRIVADAGLPPAPRSACWFCPMHSPAEWQRMKREERYLFDAAADLEDELNKRRVDELGKDRVWFSRFGRPLREVFADDQLVLFSEEGGECDSGWCFT
jgi:hypothetical protein